MRASRSADARTICDASARAATERFGRLDALVNNASSFYATPLATSRRKQWDDLIGTNLKAPLFLAQVGRARADAPARLHRQHRRHPRRAAARRARRLQHRQSRAGRVDARTGARAGSAGARERGRTRRDRMAG